ncbi:MAG: GNAT family N-acetyltransferase [Anaerolineae bacterium]|nr:GNAT family N-acetyltransferase [Anaerolineae bacterium]
MDPTTSEARDFIASRLGEFNQPYVGSDEPIKVVLGVDTETGDLVGGLSAQIYYRVMSIDLLWVDQRVRGQGVGKILIHQAEKIARRSGCVMIHLDTFDFQAPSFYEKMGFERWGELGPYPNGHKRYYYRKMIVRKPTSSAWGYKKEIEHKE